MKRLFIFFFTCFQFIGYSASKDSLSNNPGKYDNFTLLPNGWKLTPAGDNVATGELPLNMIVTSDGRFAITTNSGASKSSISLVDLTVKKEVQRLPVNDTWRGMSLSKDESKLFVSGGYTDNVYIYGFSNERLKLYDSVVFNPDKHFRLGISGVAFSGKRNAVIAVSREMQAMYLYDLEEKYLVRTIGMRSIPYDVVLDHSEEFAYVSLWGSSSIAKINLTDYSVEIIKTGDHPCEMLISKDDKWMYVTNANNNTTSVIDLAKGEEVEKLVSSLQADAPAGSTPNSAALNEDETVLFIANADNNCLALFDVSTPGNSKSLGFIPTGWYPTSVRFSPSTNKIIVANGKGTTSMANPDGPKPGQKQQGVVKYIESLFNGTVSIIGYPDKNKLAEYSAEVYTNTPYAQTTSKTFTQSVIPDSFNGKPGDKIKHVFYIIKENRTYDQVFGDITTGNGDTSLCLFPESITPNQHRLAKEFALFDNFYVDAEVSADGHNWSTAAYATDYVEKTWPTYYGDRGGSYDYEGGKDIASPTSGYIWDQVIDKGISFRNYGEFADEKTENGVKKYFGVLDKLKPYTSETYPGWDLLIRDVVRFNIWKEEFDRFVKADSLPSFQILRLPNNHTAGTAKGHPTIKAMIADNDYAVGQLVETISKSRFWQESIIFILEDDAQNGSDHVDAHRSPVLVISPYIKRHFTDHTMYSTSSVLKTIELILGLKPMTQFDLSAAAFLNPLQDSPDLTQYKSVKPDVDMNEMNTASLYGSDRSDKMNLTMEDAIPDIEFNEIIWKYMKGEDSRMPVPVRSAYIKAAD